MNTYYNLHRWYEPATGRYIAPDPLRSVLGEYGDSVLMLVPGLEYAYAADNPLLYIDPLGLTIEQGLCVLRYTLLGLGAGGLAGAAGGCALGGGATALAGGVVAIPACAAGAIGGGFGGAAIGALGGAIFGTLQCRCPEPKRRWSCTAQCYVQPIGGTSGLPDRVFGSGSGSTEAEACLNAKRNATQNTPEGGYPRHCKCKCQKN